LRGVARGTRQFYDVLNDAGNVVVSNLPLIFAARQTTPVYLQCRNRVERLLDIKAYAVVCFMSGVLTFLCSGIEPSEDIPSALFVSVQPNE